MSNPQLRSPGAKSQARPITSYFSVSTKPAAADSASKTKEGGTCFTLASPSSKKSVSEASPSQTKKRQARQHLDAPSPTKKAKRAAMDEKQWTLDVGQKDTIECTACGLVYSAGNVSDRAMHTTYHLAKLSAVSFRTTKTMEEVYVDPLDKTRKIFMLSKADAQKEQVQFLLSTIDEELNLDPSSFKPSSTEKIFVFVARGLAVGLIRTEKAIRAFRHQESSLEDQQESKLDTSLSSVSTETSTIATSSLSSSQPDTVDSRLGSSVSLGVSRIWVHADHKRQGIASILFDVARTNFEYGTIIPKSQCAMTMPTMDGREFARSYFGTPGFLVYDPWEPKSRILV